MRIISGKYKGKILYAPKKLPVRPTTDMAKEGLFNILNNHYNFSNLSVIDLFAGTGNISYEFASRGTKDITAVDGHYACLGYIKNVSKELNFTIETIKSDVYKYLEKSSSKADLIFADPPYDFETEKFSKIAILVFEKNLLKDDGVLIIEHSKHTSLEETPHFSHSRKYGGSVFSFFEK
ncbi:methyltransferase domain-containing protein [Aquimarina sp. AD10]|uniref:16S rRNA (Guanine(966)-N(2))-methyltransferase RsmD n=1 Tax=Aquimarina aggregata TaxID=1642818 RepID=A0A162CW55_9FLAO|nr:MULTISPECIES: RsmD family RNA methyltransferase [Aquimarina]AXT60041.1 methyltransferase domain-containing protein [Aquimarina sp. AD10]KZS41969.1 16S rRNA (guanine(966)-N(2))-methyltransferase RsmD [Aquimarina aggregata]RKM96183.1 methyltransferase domain-containing protein [Aquimarina sp. AD10]